MAAYVDHRARRQEIILAAIKLFAQEGYQAVTFGMLSAHTGVARTVLYRYFRDKRQIFNSAIVELLSRIVKKHTEIVHSEASAAGRLAKICTAVVVMLFDNRQFLCVIIDYVMSMKRAGYDMSRRIKKLTFGIKRVIHTLLLLGVKQGEFRRGIDADAVTDILYAQFESTVMRLAITDDAVQSDVLERIDEVLKGIGA